MMADVELVTVRTFGDHVTAEIARSALEAAGIDCAIRADDAGGMRPHMTFTLGISLVVGADDAGRAIEVLDTPAALQEQRTDSDESETS